jgi:long-chain acyl-CoA synthetase
LLFHIVSKQWKSGKFDNCPEWIISYYGTMKAGAVANPLNLMLTASEAAFAIGDCKAVGVLGAVEKLENLKDYLPQTELRFRVAFGESTDSEVVAFSELLESAVDGADFIIDAEVTRQSVSTIAYTSGTTGHPKGAVDDERSFTKEPQ